MIFVDYAPCEDCVNPEGFDVCTKCNACARFFPLKPQLTQAEAIARCGQCSYVVAGGYCRLAEYPGTPIDRVKACPKEVR